MPNKSKRHRRSSRYSPLTFSPFARSLAIAISSKKARKEIQEPKLQIDGFLNHGEDKSEQSESSDSEEDERIVDVDFAAKALEPRYFHGMKLLLQTYLDNKQWDISGFVDLILGQPMVGTVIKTVDDEDDGLYSFVTALNLRRYEDSKCIIQLKDYLLQMCRDMDVIAKLRSLVGEHAQDVGLIVSQRVANSPPQLLPQLYDVLFDEVNLATEDEPTEELRSSFRFKFYLIISRILKHRKAYQDKGITKSGDESVIYIHPEDEIFLKLSTWSFTFPLHTQLVPTDELKNYRLMGLVMVVEASKVSIFRKQLHSLIDE